MGLSTLGDFRHAQRTETGSVWRIAPDRLLIEGGEDLSALKSADLAVLDLSHARVVLRASGPQSRTLLSQLFAIDTSANAFRPSEFVQTGIHGVGVLVYCTGENDFDIIAPTTWANSLWDFISETATPLGFHLMVKA
jgi:sarcosine oxidase subunit gamma